MPPPELVDILNRLQQKVRGGMVLGLDRMLDALARLGNPHESFPAVHIAGSNGKGSVSAMVESIARTAGIRTGLYTSPHLCRFAERIRICGEPIDDQALTRALTAVLDRCAPDLTFFESMTLAAFVAFREAKVGLAILEVGLGGRLDATNVIKKPLATAITSITLEHTGILGETVEQIAREKAGILKRGVPLILGPLPIEIDQAIVEVAERVDAGPIYRTTAADVAGMEIGLKGPHQRNNAAVAMGVTRQLGARFAGIERCIQSGLAGARWPGRFERFERGGVTIVLDCAHNPEGATALVRTLREEGISPEKTALVFGALADKAWREMLAELSMVSNRRYYATPEGRKAAELADLSTLAPGSCVGDPIKALTQAISESHPGDTVVATGSIYLVGALRAHLLGIEADPVVAL